MKDPGPRFAILEDVSPPESRSTRRRLTTFGIAALVTISGLATALLLSRYARLRHSSKQHA